MSSRWMVCVLAPLLACSESAGTTGDGGSSGPKCFDSTYAAIQATVFEARGCTQSACHGDALEGDLDLRAGVSHARLVYAPSNIDPAVARVDPGEPDTSLLYKKLAAKISGDDLGMLGQAMPVAADPVSADELEAIRLWIRKGANEEQVVEGTMDKLGCNEIFEPSPNKIEPLPPPDPSVGVQFYSGGWTLPAEGEDEVCFVTHYDFTDIVPEDALTDCPPQFGSNTCFAFGDTDLAQDGQSHHSIIDSYMIKTDPNAPDWGEWTCLGGERAGDACDPSEAIPCGVRSQCATAVATGGGCNNYPNAPALFRRTANYNARWQFSGAQESRFQSRVVEGVYDILPVTGFIAWNSHAFNLTKEDTTIEQWVNVFYRFKDQQTWRSESIFDTRFIYDMTPVAPFQKKEICMTFTLPQFSRLTYLSSHMHARGKLFRIWRPPNESCGSTVMGCEAPEREADYESRIYDDPVYQYYPPDALPKYDSVNDPDRTFKACAVYDNGADNPSEVKRHSTRPNAPTCELESAHCGCDPIVRACFGGDNQGLFCQGDDSVCGEGGMCDACPLLGGVTTDDEMFIPLGSYYVETE